MREKSSAEAGKIETKRLESTYLPSLNFSLFPFGESGDTDRVKLGLSLPVWSWNKEELLEGQHAENESLNEMIKVKERDLQKESAMKRRRLQSIREQRKIYSEKLLPELHHALSLAEANFKIGKLPMMDYLKLMKETVDQDIAFEAIGHEEKVTQIEINKILGVYADEK